MKGSGMELVGNAAEWVFRTSWESSLLLGVVLLVSLTCGGRLAPRVGGLLWALVGIRLLLPVVPESPWSLFHFVSGGTEAAVVVAREPAAAGGPAGGGAGEFPERGAEGGTAVSGGRTRGPGWVWAGFVWVAVAVFILLVAAVRLRGVRRWAGRLPMVESARLEAMLGEEVAAAGVKRLPVLVEGPADGVVAVCGFLRAEWLIVPRGFGEGFGEAQIRGIFRHELEHVRRGDLAWSWVVLVVQAVHWFHPLVWMAGRAFRAEREVACDRSVVGRLSGEERAGYGRALLRAAERQLVPFPAAVPSLVPFISPKNELKHRLTMILSPHTVRPLAQVSALALAAAVVLMTLPPARAAEERPGDPGNPEAQAGPRDGEGAPKAGPKDGEGAPKAGPKEGDPAAPRPQAALLNTKGGKMFRAYDKDGSGGVSAEEIAAMREGGVSQAEIRRLAELVEDLDTDGNQKELSLEEFIRWLDLRSRGGDRG